MIGRSISAWGLILCGVSLAPAQSSRDKVSIVNVRVGFNAGPHAASPDEMVSGQRSRMFKTGGWAPVFVNVQNTGKYDPASDGPIVVSVETTDSDDTLNSYSAPLPPFDSGGSASVLLYTRAGNRYGDYTVRVQARGRELCRPNQQPVTALDSNELLYLSLGSRMPGLRLPGPPDGNAASASGRAEIGLVTRVTDLPALWFGYGSIDVVILATSDRDFMEAFLGEQGGRRAALAEWVRRGGRLIVCAGKNRDQIGGSPELQALLPMTIEGPYASPPGVLRWREGGVQPDEPISLEPMEFTRLRPRDGRSARVLIDGPLTGNDSSPLVVQGPYGLGRVTLLAFDPDTKPVYGWKNEAEFWEQLLLTAGPRIPAGQQVNQFGFRQFGGGDADATLRGIVDQLENFEGVPVISFGWVALFILLYILVVGPLDYWFLKRVVKRLEFTWITFPTIVLAVSAGAYFAAYHLKGGDLRVNRLDVVDYDLQTKQVYGRSFFSIFSPRIQKYTIGMEPSDGWATPVDESSPAPTVVSWFGVPKQGRPSFFRSTYDYARFAAGLTDVPINVWSTKGFQTWWAAPFDRENPPIAATLTHPPTQRDVIHGSVVNQLPVDLEDAILMYRGSVTTLGTWLRGVAKPVSAGELKKFSQWKDSSDSGAAPIPGAEDLRPGVHGGSGNPVAARLNLSLLFHEATNPAPSNGSVRDVDQSWRLTDGDRDEAMVVARVAQARGPSESLNAAAGNPARLWLGELPGTTNAQRPAIQGTMRQDVLVRVLIPIAPPAKSGPP